MNRKNQLNFFCDNKYSIELSNPFRMMPILCLAGDHISRSVMHSSSELSHQYDRDGTIYIDPLLAVVTVTNTVQNFAYTQILELIVDLPIDHSIITSWSVDSFKLPSWIRSVEFTCSLMIIRNKFMSVLFYKILDKHCMFHQGCSCAISNPC